MRLRPGELAVLFAIGAAGGLVGDPGHVQASTTTYLDDSLPFVWESALWFPAVAGPLAEIVIVKADLAEYAEAAHSLFGVALWLPALNLAFGVVAARLAELLVARRPAGLTDR